MRLDIMHDHAGTVIGGMTDVSRPVGAALDEPVRASRKLVAPSVEDEGRLGAVEADDHDRFTVDI